MLKPRHASDVLKHRAGFRSDLVSWFLKNGMDYPWRRTKDPYSILVSEVMLQQTRIATVLGKGYYTRFLTIFPDVSSLACAGDSALLKAWEGLGYYRRVRMLRETARAVVADHGGVFPQEVAGLLKLPGIGRYTAGALRAFAFGLPAVLVDGNVSRVLARVMDFPGCVDDPAGVRRMWEWAGELACDEHPSAYHAALMELGQTVCRPGVPDCLSCPVARYCKTRRPGELPVRKARPQVTGMDEHALWLGDSAGRILLHRESGRRRTGLWKLPLRESSELVGCPVLLDMFYPITRFRVRLRVHDGCGSDAWELRDGDAWVDSSEWESLAIAAPFRSAIRKISSGFDFPV